jgi:hypothetical protein
MKKITILFTTMLLLGAGCDNSDDGGGKAYPTVGSRVDVQLRRDYLGIHATPPQIVGVMSEGANQPVAASGVLARVTDDFVVLQVDNEPNRELWIPRGAILLMDVKKKQ